jgi:integrase
MSKLTKRKDGRYAKQITVGVRNGKPVKKTVYGRTIKEVEEKYMELTRLINKGVTLDYKAANISSVIDEWYRLRIFPNVNPNTQKRYKYFMEFVKDHIGDMKIQDVKRYTIESMFEEMKNNGNTSAHDRLMLLKKFFNYAVDNDIIFKNPCNGISIQYAPKQKRLLTKEELDKIANCDLTSRDKAYLYILRYTGMRNGEVLALQKSDIDRKNMTISINKTIVSATSDIHIQERTKTDAGNRIIPIFLPLSKPLFDYIDRLPEDQEQLFLSNVGKLYSITAGCHLFRRIIKDCGIVDSEITPHYLRHNFISECYKAGIDIKKVQTWVGHADIQTTLNIYTHLEKDIVQDGSDLDNFYGSQTEVKRNLKVAK